MTTAQQPRVCLFGIGRGAYLPQFAGLEERLVGYLGEPARRLAAPGDIAARVNKLRELLDMRVEQVC